MSGKKSQKKSRLILQLSFELRMKGQTIFITIYNCGNGCSFTHRDNKTEGIPVRTKHVATDQAPGHIETPQVMFGLLLVTLILSAMAELTDVDCILRGGLIVDGSGQPAYIGDLAIKSDKIVGLGKIDASSATQEINISGLVVSPGFINGLSWAYPQLLQDPAPLVANDVLQGVTLEILGEGQSAAPFGEFATIPDFFAALEKQRFTPNIAVNIGHTNVRMAVLGDTEVLPTAAQLLQMQSIVEQGMLHGALGVSSSLIYPPATYANTSELIALAQVAGKHGGVYTSHIRSEGYDFESAIEEVVTVAVESNCSTMIYHLKVAGESNWYKLDTVLRMIGEAQKKVNLVANMYPYTAGGTGITAIYPPWSLEGGAEAFFNRLKDPQIRAKIKQDILSPNLNYDNLYNYTGGNGTGIVFLQFTNASYDQYIGKSLSEVAVLKGMDPLDVAFEITLTNPPVGAGTRVEVMYFISSEANIAKVVQLPYVSYCSDGGAWDTITKAVTHPRDFGAFSKIFRKYVREDKLLTLEQAVHSATGKAARFFNIKSRGELQIGNFADIVIFNASTFADHSTYEKPQQFATGMKYVFINGIKVVENGRMTGEKPGRFVLGPGYRNQPNMTLILALEIAIPVVLFILLVFVFVERIRASRPQSETSRYTRLTLD